MLNSLYVPVESSFFHSANILDGNLKALCFARELWKDQRCFTVMPAAFVLYLLGKIGFPSVIAQNSQGFQIVTVYIDRVCVEDLLEQDFIACLRIEISYLYRDSSSRVRSRCMRCFRAESFASSEKCSQQQSRQNNL